MHSKASSPSLLLNLVATGYPYAGVPCFSCVKKVKTTDDIGLPGPYNYVLTGDTEAGPR